MAENIVISFEADTKDLQTTIDLLEKLGQVDAKTAAEFRKATEEYKKRQTATKATADEMKAFVAQAEKLGVKLPESLRKGSSSLSDFRSKLLEVGKVLGIAFSIAEVIRFGKESVKAFQEAELTAKKLQTAVSVNGGLQKDFEILIEQSKQLQDITIFSDDDIQNAQTAALQFGLTRKQVQELIPVVLDFASATGQTLPAALDRVLAGIRGQGRGLKDYQVEVSATATKQENLKTITDQLTKSFSGQAEIVGNTSFGAMEKLKNKFNDFQEDVGEFVVDAGEATSAIVLWIANGFKPLDEELDNTTNALKGTRGEIQRIQKAIDTATVASLRSQLQSLAANDAPAEALARINKQLKELSLREFNQQIGDLNEKELTAKFKAIQEESKKTTLVIADQGTLSFAEKLKIVNDELEALL